MDTSPAEDDLLEFLTPEASGMSNIPEGGAISDVTDLTIERVLTPQKWQNPSTLHLPICTDLTAERVSSQKLENPSTLQITKFSISPNLHTEKIIRQATSCFQGLEVIVVLLYFKILIIIYSYSIKIFRNIPSTAT